MTIKYDAFLSYNSKDRDTVTAIANYLEEKEGLKLFFDQWEMIPGTPVQEALEKSIAKKKGHTTFLFFTVRCLQRFLQSKECLRTRQS